MWRGRISTTTLESYRLFMAGDWMPERDLLDTIEGKFTPNDKIRLGLAFENILQDPYRYLVPGGYVCDGFRLDRAEMDPCLDLVDRRGVFQVQATKAYGGREVVVKCDQLLGTTVFDWKTTQSPFDAEKYLESYQWRYTLNILPAQEFVYQVFLLNDHGNGVVEVRGVETVRVFPYPALTADCLALLNAFSEYVSLKGLEGLLSARQVAAGV